MICLNFQNFEDLKKNLSYLAFWALWLSMTDCPCFSYAFGLRKTSVALICDGFMADLLSMINCCFVLFDFERGPKKCPELFSLPIYIYGCTHICICTHTYR